MTKHTNPKPGHRGKHRGWWALGFHLTYLLVVFSLMAAVGVATFAISLMVGGSGRKSTLPPRGGGFT